MPRMNSISTSNFKAMMRNAILSLISCWISSMQLSDRLRLIGLF